MRTYRELEVWQKAMDLVVEVYRATKHFPGCETYALANQLRRAAVSVPSNIAEGQGRRTTKEFLNRLSLARGSLAEVATQLEIAQRLGYLPAEQFEQTVALAGTVARLTNGLIAALERKLGE